jgi:hypothetical protein
MLWRYGNPRPNREEGLDVNQKEPETSQETRIAALQLADMCVSAIARTYRADRSDADRWRGLQHQGRH